MRRAWRGGLALLAGALVALSLPPFGLWPLGIAGTALLARLLHDRRSGARLLAGLLTGIGQFGIGLAWAEQFTLPGYLVLVLVESAFLALAALAVPPRRGRVAGFAAALVLAEAARDAFPFGGLPLGSAVLGQAAGPLAALARLAGPLTVLAGLALAGSVLAELEQALSASRFAVAGEMRTWRIPPLRWATAARRAGGGAARRAGGAGAALLALCVVALVAPDGGPAVGHVAVAAVQGGRLAPARDLPAPVQVLDAQLSATARLSRGVQRPGMPPRSATSQRRDGSGLRSSPSLVLWPEDVVALDVAFATSPERAVLAATARRLGATLIAGVTEPAGPGHFRNEVVALAPSGRLVATFEKVHLVPFGEYVPDRSLFSHLADFAAVPLDAVSGRGDGEITTPAGRFAVLISFETFFTARGRSGVRAGGEALLVPTNTASYSTSQAPGQELAASRLQAVAEGRDLLQAATVGYSAIVSTDGAVRAASRLGARAVLSGSIALRSGMTLYDRFGDPWLLALAVVGLGGSWLAARRRAGDQSARAGSSPEAATVAASRPSGSSESSAPLSPSPAGETSVTPPSPAAIPAGEAASAGEPAPTEPSRSARPSGRSAKRTLLKRMNLPTQITA
ncbi:MAG TPA: nitrilase-related carbon-nitrogen hydrolase [Acidimicrobiales bacterium]|nr:nitrilase-related carbon-nitrogen hydrolase [Acidimicrobiales bacterium]